MRWAIPLAAGLLVAAPVGAKASQVSLLTPTELDAALVLPPPPTAGSAQATADLAELRAIEASRTPADEAAARLDGDTKNASIFVEVLGQRFDLAALPATRRLLDIVRATEKDVIDRGKDHFRRQRPYVVAPDLKSCKRNDDPFSSYPSGHATMAFSMADTLARILPARAPELLARAARYAQSRIVCEQHFRSDVTAGETLGAIVVERLARKPTFTAAVSEAQLELMNAGIR